MRSFVLSAALAAFALPAAAQSWETQYRQTARAGEVSSCNAGIRYSNAAFATRMYGSEMDIYVQKDGVQLAPGRALGVASVAFDGAAGRRVVTMRATSYPEADPGSSLTSAIILSPTRAQMAELTALLRGASMASLRFADGQALTVSLRGSNAALMAQQRCWTTYATGPVGTRETLIARGRF